MPPVSVLYQWIFNLSVIPPFGTNTGKPIAIRLAVESNSGTWYGSSTAFNLALDNQWHHATFELADLSLISGAQSLGDVLADVKTLRVLSAISGPTWQGDNIVVLIIFSCSTASSCLVIYQRICLINRV